MSEPEKTCLTCQWWFRFEPTDKMGSCVFHTGIRGAPLAKIKFNGTLRTVPHFACNCWEENRRPAMEVPE